MQNSIYKIKYLLFLSWDWEAWCLTQSGRGGIIPPPQKNIAWNKGRKCFHCLGAPNNLISPCLYAGNVYINHTIFLLMSMVSMVSMVYGPFFEFQHIFFIIVLSEIKRWEKRQAGNYDTIYVTDVFLETATYITLVQGNKSINSRQHLILGMTS